MKIQAKAWRDDRPGAAVVELAGERLDITVSEAQRACETAWLTYGWAFNDEPTRVKLEVS